MFSIFQSKSLSLSDLLIFVRSLLMADDENSCYLIYDEGLEPIINESELSILKKLLKSKGIKFLEACLANGNYSQSMLCFQYSITALVQQLDIEPTSYAYEH